MAERADAPLVSLLPGRVQTRREHVWGTVVSLIVRDDDAPAHAVDAAWDSVRAELHRVDAVFSTFRQDSVITRLRAGGQHVVADDVAEVAGWLSPRIGGVGPMTRAMLLVNTVEAAERRVGLVSP